MKNILDPRHLKRIAFMQEVFSTEFSSEKVKRNKGSMRLRKLLGQLSDIDTLIQQAAPAWPIVEMNKIDLAILRICVFELLQQETPPKVVLDEAIEIAKTYGAERSAQFVNGVLATISEQMKKKENA